jgi:hypothetical protein
MIKFAPAGLSIVLTLVTANAFAQERGASQSPSPKSVVDCAAPAIPERSQLIVIPSERINGDMLLGLDEFGSEMGKSYAHAGAGDIGPGTDGLRTFYPSDRSDEVFGQNPISQMVVVTLKASYEHCFSSPPSIAKLEDVVAANGAAILGLNLDDPRMEWKGGINGVTDNEMWSSKTVGLAMPPSFGPTELKALDVAAWNNKQLQYLPKRAEQSQPRAY